MADVVRLARGRDLLSRADRYRVAADAGVDVRIVERELDAWESGVGVASEARRRIRDAIVEHVAGDADQAWFESVSRLLEYRRQELAHYAEAVASEAPVVSGGSFDVTEDGTGRREA